MKKLNEILADSRRIAFQACEPLIRSSEVTLIFDIKIKTLYTMAYRNKIPSYRIDGWRMFNVDDLEGIFKRRSQDEMHEIFKRHCN